MSAPELLAADLDGTLTAPGADRIASADLAALEAAAAQGVLIVIATGRSIRTSSRHAEQLPVNAPWILHNGALTVEWPGPAIVAEALLDVETARRAVALIRECGLAPMVFGNPHRGQQVFLERATTEMERFLALNPGRVEWVGTVENELDSPPTLISGMAQRPAAEAAAERLRRELGRAASVIVMSNGRYGHWSVEVQSPACRKDVALREILEAKGIRPAAVVAIGDEVNDVGMLKLAGLGLAMADGRPEALAAADGTVVPTPEGRICAAVERHVLATAPARVVSDEHAD